MNKGHRVSIVWMVFLGVLAIGEVFHYVEHLEASCPHSHHGNSHHREPIPADDEGGDSHGFVEHCHSPAVLNAESGSRFLGMTAVAWPEQFGAPESPAFEIEHPPQRA